MRRFLILLAACGGHPTSPQPKPPAEPPYTAARWVPERPTYVVAARTVRDAQHALKGAVEAVGPALGVRPRDVIDASLAVLGVDATNEDAVAAIGIDTDGGIAVFSDDLDPTIVVRVAAPASFAAFVEQQRGRGLATRSMMVDGTEVFSAQVAPDLALVWAQRGEWLWAHVATSAPDDTGWFSRSVRGAWRGAAAWARGKARAIAGFADVRAIVQRLRAAVACARLVAPIRGVALSGDGDLTRFALSARIDLGPAAKDVVAHVLAPPPGWSAAASGAPLAVEWNLDLDAVAAAVEPCLGRHPLAAARAMHLRAARAIVLDVSGRLTQPRGALSADLSDRAVLAGLLDQVPMRAQVERDHTFGSLAGHRVQIPFGLSFDYVLTDRVALASNVDGLLDKIVAGSARTPPPLASIDVVPRGLTVEQWEKLLSLLGAPDFSAALARWQQLHAALRIEGEELVVELAGERR